MKVNAAGVGEIFASSVGIGTNAPNAPLQFSNDLENRKIVLFEGANNDHQYFGFGVNGSELRYQTNGADHVFWAGVNATTSTEIMRIKNTGRVGIGTNNPGFTLQVNGSVAGIGVYNNLSDQRFKKDIAPIDNALNKVLRLEGITYNWDNTLNPELNIDDKNHIGFLAQEVEKILPQVVNTASDSLQTKTVEYSSIVPVLVEGIKEQQALIESQEVRIAELEKRLAKTNQENTSLKASATVSTSTSEAKVLQSQLDAMQSQIDKLTAILTAEASKGKDD